LEDLFALAVATQYPTPVVDENGKLVGEIDNDTILSSMIQYRETKEVKIKDTETGEISTKETKSNA
jgi:Mg/Co/Ni transporter MgtE